MQTAKKLCTIPMINGMDLPEWISRHSRINTTEQEYLDIGILMEQELQKLYEIQTLDRIMEDPSHDLHWQIVHIS
jgi:hypothetical protein